MMAKMGRPPFDESIRNRICEEVGKGNSLETVCRMDGMPSPSTVYQWLKDEPDFSENYARAKDERAERHFEETLEIADSATAENIQVAKLRVDTRKWFVSKMAPKSYGDKVSHEHTGEDGGPVEVKTTVKVVHVNSDADN